MSTQNTAVKDISTEIKDIKGTGDAAQYFAGLSKSQQRAAASLLGYSKEQAKFVKEYAKLIQQGEMFNVSILKQSKGFKELTQSQTESLFSSGGLIGAITKENSVRKNELITVLQSTAAHDAIGKEKADAIIKEIAYTAAIKSNTSALLANTKAAMAAAVQNPYMWIMLGVTAISLIVQWYNEWNVTLEENLELLDEAESTYQGAVSNLEQIVSELDEVKSRLEEINALSLSRSLTDSEKEEQLSLKKTNSMLEEQIALLENKKELEFANLTNQFKKTVSEANKVSSIAPDEFKWGENGYVRAFRDGEFKFGADIDHLSNENLHNDGIGINDVMDLRLERVDQIDQKIRETNLKISSAVKDGNTELANSLKEEVSELESDRLFNMNEINRWYEATYSETQAIISKYGDISSIPDEILRAQVEKNQDVFTRYAQKSVTTPGATDSDIFKTIVSDESHADAVSKIKDLARQGVLTTDTLDNLSFSPLLGELQGLGFGINEIIDRFILLAKESDDAEKALYGASLIDKYSANAAQISASAATKSATEKVLSEFASSGFVAKDTLMDLESTIPGAAAALLNADGTWSKAGETVLKYSDNVNRATIELYKAIIAQKQFDLQSLDPSSSSYDVDKAAIENDISLLQARLDTLRDGWQSAVESIVADATSSLDTLRTAMTDLSTGGFEDWDSEFIEKLLSDFPNLTDEVNEFANGTRDATSLAREMKNAFDESVYTSFVEALSEVSDAVEEYGEDSYQVQEELENLYAIIPGLNGALYDEDGALTTVGQAALLAAAGNKEAAIQMLQAAITARTLDLSQAREQLFNLANAGLTAAAGVAAAKQAIATGEADLKTLNGLMNKIKSGEFKVSGGGGKSKGGGGSSKEKDVLEDYKAQQKILEHRADMSKSAQDLMQEDTDEWRSEQQKQYDIYLEYAQLIQNEMERLRKLGYDSNSEQMMTLEKDFAKVQKSMYDLQKSAWEESKKSRLDAIKAEKEAAQKAHEAEMDRLNALIKRQQALIGLLNQQHSLYKDLSSERYSLNRELANAQAYVGLSESERSALFSDADYNQLMGVIDEIQNEAVAAYNTYLSQIKAVNTDEAYKLDYITSQYEQQYALMAKKYEVAKQDLALARARIALENAQKDRSVAMIVNGRWTWQADPEAIKNSMESMFDIEQSKAEAQSDLIHQQKLNELEAFKASIEMEKEAAQAVYDALMEMLDEQMELIEQENFAFDVTIENLYGFASGVESAGNALAAATSSAISAVKSAASSAMSSISSAMSQLNQSTQNISKAERNAIDKIIKDDKAAGNNKSSTSSSKSNVTVGGGGGGGGGKMLGMYYADGGVATKTDLAMMHGSKTSPEIVFNATDAAKLYDIIHNGDPLREMLNNILEKNRGITSLVGQNVTNTQPGVQYIINGLTFGEESGGLTLRQLANQLSSAAPFLR